MKNASLQLRAVSVAAAASADTRRPRAVLESLEGRTLLASVAVDLGTTFQTMQDLGGNYSRAPFQNYPANDAIGRYTLDHLKPGVVRVPIHLLDWEPANDNADPAVRNAAGFNTTGESRDLFLMMQEYERRGLTIVATVYNAPNWMVSNPTAGSGRVVPRENWAELTESMSSFMETARSDYGVTIDYVSFNESNGGYSLLFNAQDHGDFIAAAGPEFAARGVPTKWLVGDTFQVRGTVDYAKAILDNAAARPYLGPVAFHSWWSLGIANSEWRGIADLAAQYGVPVWTTEIGYDANLWRDNPGIFPTYEYAENTARTYHNAIKHAGASVALYWQYQDDFPLMSADTTTLYPAYHAVKSLVENFSKGTQVVGSNSDTSTILPVAGRHVAGDRFSMQVINTAGAAQTVTLSGLPNNPLTLTRTSGAGDRGAVVGTYTPVNGRLTLTLAGDSVNMLGGKLAAPQPPAQTPYKGKPFAVGTAGVTIQAEDFDNGGRNVAFFDNRAGNDGNVYRTTDVDLRPTTDAGGGYRLASTYAGEWLEYTIDVATAGNYDLSFRVGNTAAGGKIRAEVDGANVTGSLAVPNTTSFDKFATVTKRGVALSAGTHVLRLFMESNATNTTASTGSVNWIRIIPAPATPTQTPYKGTPVPIAASGSSIVQAEDFDNGGKGVAYFDNSAGNDGNVYRTGDVDIRAFGTAGYRLASTAAGEWLEYTVNVQQAGQYAVNLRVGNTATGGKLRVEVDGVNVTGSLAVPNTGSFSTFADTASAVVSLTAGTHVLRLLMEANATNSTASTGSVDYIRFTRVATATALAGAAT